MTLPILTSARQYAKQWSLQTRWNLKKRSTGVQGVQECRSAGRT